MRETLWSWGSTGETPGGGEGRTWGERTGREVRKRRGMWENERGDYLCIQEHCTVVSAANKETKKLANVGNRCHSCRRRRKTNVPGKRKKEKKRKTEEKVRRLVILITRQNADLTSVASTFTHDGVWKWANHHWRMLMSWATARWCCRCRCGRFNRIKREPLRLYGLLMKNNAERSFKKAAALQWRLRRER